MTYRPTWYAWLNPITREWHAGYSEGDSTRYFYNISWEEREDCAEYIRKADLEELKKIVDEGGYVYRRTPPPRGVLHKQILDMTKHLPIDEAEKIFREAMANFDRQEQTKVSLDKIEEPEREGPPRDDRFEWVEITNFAGETEWTKGRCHHKHVDPVGTLTGELVRWLCLDCGREWDPDKVPWPVPEDMWRPVPALAVPEPNGYEKWVYGSAFQAATPCPHDHRDGSTCACPSCPKCRPADGHRPEPIFVAGGVIYPGVHQPSWWERERYALAEFFGELWNWIKNFWPIYLVLINFVYLIWTGKL